MNALARFWLVVIGALVTLTSFLYLFLSLAFPNSAQILASTQARITAIIVGLVATCVLLLAVLVIDFEHPKIPEQRP